MRDPALLEWEGGQLVQAPRVPDRAAVGEARRHPLRRAARARRGAAGSTCTRSRRAVPTIGALRVTLDGVVRWTRRRSRGLGDRPRVADGDGRRSAAARGHATTRPTPRSACAPTGRACPRRPTRSPARGASLVAARHLAQRAREPPAPAAGARVVLERAAARRPVRGAGERHRGARARARVRPRRRATRWRRRSPSSRGIEPDGASDVSLAPRSPRIARPRSRPRSCTSATASRPGARPRRRRARRAGPRAAARRRVPRGRGRRGRRRARCCARCAVRTGGALRGAQAPGGRHGARVAPRERAAHARAARRDAARRARRDVVLPGGARALFEDDDWQVIVRSPKGAAPASVVLRGPARRTGPTASRSPREPVGGRVPAAALRRPRGRRAGGGRRRARRDRPREPRARRRQPPHGVPGARERGGVRALPDPPPAGARGAGDGRATSSRPTTRRASRPTRSSRAIRRCACRRPPTRAR